jgi:POT family proton-dependent oligopeptide transporter
MFKKHPLGLPFLFFTELWERFGYYLMIGIFVLFMEDTQKGGLSMTGKQAADIFGTFIALNYLTPFFGGMLADRWLGYRKAVVIGGILMGLGYLGLAIPNMNAFWGALFLIILGNGFFKPNISILLGNLYNEKQYKEFKDTGYNIFYMGINIGAFICNFIAAYMRNQYGWGYAFAAAGIGMFVGVVVFWIGDKHYAHADIKTERKEGEASVLSVLASVLLPAILTGFIGYTIPNNIFGSDSTDAFILGCIPIIIYFLNVWRTAAKHEKQPIAALLAIYAVVVIFWAIFKQNGTALTKWAELYTDREVATSWSPSLQKIGMVQTLTNQKSLFPKYDASFRVPKGADGKVQKDSTIHPYFINAPNRLPTEGGKLSIYNTELFQSVNPFFVVVLTPLIIGFFGWRRRRGKEPTTASKIGWGLIISSLSSVVMVGAVYATHNGMDKGSAWWLVGTYGVITVGELCLSPMGLSLVSKLAPARIAALMMGGWQLANAIGNKLSGVLASMWDSYENKANFFMVNSLMALAAGIVIFLMIKWLNRIIQEYVK